MIKKATARKILALYDAEIRAVEEADKKATLPTAFMDRVAYDVGTELFNALRAKLELPFGYQSLDRTPDETAAILGNVIRRLSLPSCLGFWFGLGVWRAGTAGRKLFVHLLK